MNYNNNNNQVPVLLSKYLVVSLPWPVAPRVFILGTEAALFDFRIMFLRNWLNRDFGGGGGGGGGGISGFRVTSVWEMDEVKWIIDIQFYTSNRKTLFRRSWFSVSLFRNSYFRPVTSESNLLFMVREFSNWACKNPFWAWNYNTRLVKWLD